jgi:hypothetical protein
MRKTINLSKMIEQSHIYDEWIIGNIYSEELSLSQLKFILNRASLVFTDTPEINQLIAEIEDGIQQIRVYGDSGGVEEYVDETDSDLALEYLYDNFDILRDYILVNC